jgi:hypothetical protein
VRVNEKCISFCVVNSVQCAQKLSGISMVCSRTPTEFDDVGEKLPRKFKMIQIFILI